MRIFQKRTVAAGALGQTGDGAAVAAHEEWDLDIQPDASWINLRLGELWRYRDLTLLLVHRDLVAKYKQTVLGPVWHLIQPLLTTVIFTVVFGNIAGIATNGVPKFIFYLSGTVIWGYFAKSFTDTSTTFVKNANIFGKVYFPRLVMPISIVTSNLISFVIQFLFFLCFVAYYVYDGAPVAPNRWMLMTPVLVLMMAGLGLGFGIIISSMTTKYRDLTQLVAFGVTLLMYATPVIYPLSGVPDAYRMIVLANPMTAVVETFRYAYLGAGVVAAPHLLYSGACSLIVLIGGIMLFNRVERTFMDTV